MSRAVFDGTSKSRAWIGFEIASKARSLVRSRHADMFPPPHRACLSCRGFPRCMRAARREAREYRSEQIEGTCHATSSASWPTLGRGEHGLKTWALSLLGSSPRGCPASLARSLVPTGDGSLRKQLSEEGKLSTTMRTRSCYTRACDRDPRSPEHLLETARSDASDAFSHLHPIPGRV